jgi:multidrug efflux pump
MTTLAALFGALPLAIGLGRGIRTPPPSRNCHRRRLARLTVLTLFTTPVVYLALERFRSWTFRFRRSSRAPELLGETA